jgi:hypothetical protein
MADMGVSFDDAPVEAAGGQRKKLVVLALAAALAVVLAVFVVPSLLGGDDAAATKPTVKKATARVTPKAKAAVKAKPKPKPKPKATFNGKLGRDPFKALYVPSAEKLEVASPVTGADAGTGGTGGGDVPGKGTVVVTTPQPQPQPQPTPQPTPVVTPTPATIAIGLVDVANEGQVATVTVLYKGLSYDNMPVGTKFGPAKELQVVSAVGKCGSFLYGQAQIALCEGEQRTLRLRSHAPHR